jgi:hypothetical protein
MLDRRLQRFALAGCLAAALLPAAAPAAEPAKVLVVVGVRAPDRQAYLARVASYEAATKRLGLPTARVWRAMLAGDAADTIYVVTEYASAAAWAAAQQKLAADPEATAALREMEASGVRTVVERSLLVEATP